MDKTEAILEYIIEFSDENGYPPVIREIQEGCEISSTSVVAYHLEKLIKSGDISKGKNKARTIKVNGKK
jgi:repressor LexA